MWLTLASPSSLGLQVVLPGWHYTIKMKIFLASIKYFMFTDIQRKLKAIIRQTHKYFVSFHVVLRLVKIFKLNVSLKGHFPFEEVLANTASVKFQQSTVLIQSLHNLRNRMNWETQKYDGSDGVHGKCTVRSSFHRQLTVKQSGQSLSRQLCIVL